MHAVPCNGLPGGLQVINELRPANLVDPNDTCIGQVPLSCEKNTSYVRR